MISVCTFLLFPAFFLYLWVTLAWGANGYSFHFGRFRALPLVPVLWLLCVAMVFAFNGLAVFLERSFSFISVSWFFISLNMVPLIFLAQWNEPGGAKREELWIKAGSHSAISQRRKTLAGTGVGVGVGDTPTVVNENVSLRAESFSAVNGTQKTEVPLVWNAGDRKSVV
jgi:hypothetical protein